MFVSFDEFYVNRHINWPFEAQKFGIAQIQL